MFNHEKHKNDKQLSNELWKIKASKEEPVLVWKGLGQHQPYNVNTKRCLLYLNEKLQIAVFRGNNMLNKQTEVISKCRQENKYALASYDSMNWNIRCKVEVSWDYWNFLSLWQLWSRLTEASSISVNLKSRFYVTYIAHKFHHYSRRHLSRE